jgi:transposase
MWTKKNRRRYDRSGLRYESDLTDEEWAPIAPFIPPVKPGSNKRKVSLREVANGLMYILSTGCQWRAIPKDLAACSTVHDYFDRWSQDGTLERILRIPTRGGQAFRSDRGHRSDLMAATIPI